MATFYQKARKVAWSSKTAPATNKLDGQHASRGNSEKPRQAQKLSRSAGPDLISEALMRDGGVVIRDFADTATLKHVRDELMPFLGANGGQSEILETGVVYGLLTGFIASSEEPRALRKILLRSSTYRETFCADKLYWTLAERFLGLPSRSGTEDRQTSRTIQPLFSKAVSLELSTKSSQPKICAGDQEYYPRRPRVDEYEFGRDILLNLFIADVDQPSSRFIRFVPGSHLWNSTSDDSSRSNGHAEATEIELRHGEALILLGSMHYTINLSRQVSIVRQEQIPLLHMISSCSGIYRQQENSFLLYSREELEQFSPYIQQRLGWKEAEVDV